jgi:malate/lactate dehydrogenase
MTKVKRVGIYGIGNVGAAFLMQLADKADLADEFVAAARNIEQAKAGILDIAGAYPTAANRFSAASELTGDFDIVVVTAGAMPHGTFNLEELLRSNVAIVESAMQQVTCKLLVVIGTPVDRLTDTLTAQKRVKAQQIIGFGGQLDQARIQYALLTRNIVSDSVYAIGEHGPRTIPTYPGEAQFDDVKADASSVLKRIGAAGTPRNLATGVQLARLVEVLAGKKAVICVCAPHPAYDSLCLTWPFRLNANGVEAPESIVLGPKATKALNELIAIRKQERAA